MNTLVTGASGFIGTNLVRRLVAQGEAVRILRRSFSNTRGLEELPLETAIGDVRDLDSVRRAVEGCSKVYHLAAKLNVASRDWERFLRTNVDGTANVARASLEAGVERFVHCSSIAAVGWGPPESPATEGTPFNLGQFRIPYIHSKQRAEVVIHEFVAQGLPAVIVNPAYVFGSWDKRSGANRLIQIVASGYGWLSPPSGGISIVDVEDVVDGMSAAMVRGRVGERYILGGDNVTFHELFALTAKLSGQHKPLAEVPYPVLWGAAAVAEALDKLIGVRLGISREMVRFSRVTHFVSSVKAERELGYRFRPAEEVVMRSLQWLEKEGKI